MSKNPITDIFNDKKGNYKDAEYVHNAANDSIETYLKDHHTEKDIKTINEFIGQYNNTAPKDFKIKYDVVNDDAGNIYAHKGSGDKQQFAKIYSNENEVQINKSVSEDFSMRVFSALNSDNNISATDSKILALANNLKVDHPNQDIFKTIGNAVKDILNGRQPLDKNDIEQVYKYASEDKVISPAEKKAINIFIDENADIGLSHVKSLGQTLIYEKDPVRHGQAKGVDAKNDRGDLFDRYQGDAEQVVYSHSNTPESPDVNTNNANLPNNKPKAPVGGRGFGGNKPGSGVGQP